MTIEDTITAILKAEGGDKVTNNSLDSAGKTQFGVSQKWNPEAWEDGKVTEAEARDIYYRTYVQWPKFDLITDPNLQAQLVDYGVNSGPYIAIQKLQSILGTDTDGVIGPRTLELLETADMKMLNNQLVAARIRMIAKIVKKSPSQAVFIVGWCERALSFLR